MRAVCFTQLAFEAALRGGEVHHLKICDLIFVQCGDRCGIRCKGSHEVDAFLFVRLAKNSSDGRVQCTRLVWPSKPVLVRGRPVSALWAMVHVWSSVLKRFGYRRHPNCQSTSASRARCLVCPPIFPTFPRKAVSVVRSVSVTEVSQGMQRIALLIGRDPSKFSSKSARIGGYSEATAQGVVPADAVTELRWGLTSRTPHRKPHRTYKRANTQESRAVGLALHAGVAAAAGARAGAAVGSTAMVCLPSALACPFAAFPVHHEQVCGVVVCRRFQFGVCPHGAACKRAHVCHHCGVKHQGGRLCAPAQHAVSAWMARKGAGAGGGMI